MDMSLMVSEPGWYGMFTRNQAKGAIPNGTKIVKANSEPGDTTTDGTPGIVLGSLRAPDSLGGLLFYFVEWADKPKQPIGTFGLKIRAAE